METFISSTAFRKYSDFMKIHPVGTELFHADRRTNMTKLIVAFRSFANAHTNSTFCVDCQIPP